VNHRTNSLKSKRTFQLLEKSPARSAARLPEHLNAYLNQYALAASAAGVGLVALTMPAEAKIVYTPTHKYIEGKGSTLSIDLNNNGTVDFQLGISGSSKGELLAAWGYTSGARVYTSRGESQAAAFPAGVRIGGNRAVQKPPKGGDIMEWVSCLKSGVSCRSGGNWLDVRRKYLGLAFNIQGKTHYGWARLNASISQQYGVRALLTGYAYETVPGKAIVTGKTKGPDVVTTEPDTAAGSLGRLALGRR